MTLIFDLIYLFDSIKNYKTTGSLYKLDKRQNKH